MINPLKASSDQRTQAAAVIEIPKPVQRATCAARQAGHFGIKTQIPSDAAADAMSRMRRDAGELCGRQ